MKSLARGALFAWALGLAAPAVAQTMTGEEVIAALRAEGYATIDTGWTLLGRLRITAFDENGAMREIVIHVRTGEVLRDKFYAVAPERPDFPAGSRNAGQDQEGSGRDSVDDRPPPPPPPAPGGSGDDASPAPHHDGSPPPRAGADLSSGENPPPPPTAPRNGQPQSDR